MLRAVTSIVAPPLCALCGAPCDYSDSICRRCDRRLAELHATRSELSSGLEVISAAPYDGVARQLVTRMKFAARLSLVEVAAERMVRAWGATRRGWLVPVPAAPARARARGHDDAYALARSIQHASFGLVMLDLARDDGPRQVGRPRAERVADPPRIRRINAKLPLLGDDLWLVDDVVTTGATLDACAAVLREAGATRVRALTFARATDRPDKPPQQRRGSASPSGLRLTALARGPARRNIELPARATKGADVRIEVRGRNVEVTDELEDAIHKRFKRVGRQVSELATLEIELSEERNPRVADSQIAEATLHLKRTTIRAHEASPEMLHSIHKIAEDVRRQVKKNRELRRGRERTRRVLGGLRDGTA